MQQFFKASLTVGGLGTIGAAVFYSLYTDWLTLDIFSQLSSQHTFYIMVIFLLFVFLSVVFFLIAHILKNIKSNSAKASNGSIAVINNK